MRGVGVGVGLYTIISTYTLAVLVGGAYLQEITLVGWFLF